MSTPPALSGLFPHTTRFLQARALRRQGHVLLVLALLFGAWLAWLKLGSISVYVVSKQARLEARGQPVTIQAPVDGQITMVDIHLGRQVQPGDVLMKLDAKPLELQRETLRVAERSGKSALDALRDQLRAEERALEAVSALASQSSTTASARVAQERKALQLKEEERRMVNKLHEAAAATGVDAMHAAATVESERAQLRTTSAQAQLDTRSSDMTLRDREARLASVRFAVAQAEADVNKLTAQLATLDYEIDRRTVRSLVSGTVADVLPLTAGMTVTSQTRVATVLPNGDVRVIALYSPEESVGRMKAGQRAVLRIDNFPWTQYGVVNAVVEQVGREPRDGMIRVELAVPTPNPAIPLEHGLTATCEVEVARESPLSLVLRSAGRLVHIRPSST